MWAISADDVADKPQMTISDQKLLVTIFWSVDGFDLVEIMPPSGTFNSEYFCAEILTPLFASVPRSLNFPRLIHFDNARPHVSKRTSEFIKSKRFTKLPHPPFSPDLAPTDFYLLGLVKERLKKQGLVTSGSLEDQIWSILKTISKEELKRVFDSWVDRVRQVILKDGKYIG
jgi:histone-lysine N-methyltransferase SETMAR